MNLFSEQKRKARDRKHFAHRHNETKLRSPKVPVYENRPQQTSSSSKATGSQVARYTERWLPLSSQLALSEPGINVAKATAVPKKDMAAVHGQPSHKRTQVKWGPCRSAFSTGTNPKQGPTNSQPCLENRGLSTTIKFCTLNTGSTSCRTHSIKAMCP